MDITSPLTSPSPRLHASTTNIQTIMNPVFSPFYIVVDDFSHSLLFFGQVYLLCVRENEVCVCVCVKLNLSDRQCSQGNSSQPLAQSSAPLQRLFLSIWTACVHCERCAHTFLSHNPSNRTSQGSSSTINIIIIIIAAFSSQIFIFYFCFPLRLDCLL